MVGPNDRVMLKLPDEQTIPLGDGWLYRQVPGEAPYPPRVPWDEPGGLTPLCAICMEHPVFRSAHLKFKSLRRNRENNSRKSRLDRKIDKNIICVDFFATAHLQLFVL